MRAMILAAGRGERMRPLTDSTPKPLLLAGGKPLIVWHIKRLVQAGITQLVINHAWLGQQIEDQLQDGRQFGAHIVYSPEPEPLETAGGIAQALPFFQNEPFLVVNGDIWCDWNPDQAWQIGQSLLQQEKLAWLLLASNPGHHSAGDFVLNGAIVSDRSASEQTLALTFTGIGIYRPELFQSLKSKQPARLAPILRDAMLSKKVTGTHYNGKWIDVGTPERLASLDHSLRV
ncbi:MAG TPA: nucleotidyltransferase family protein [Eoetvoesiella sp.]